MRRDRNEKRKRKREREVEIEVKRGKEMKRVVDVEKFSGPNVFFFFKK